MSGAVAAAVYYCALCGRERLARRCGCQGAARDIARWLGQAQALRDAAAINAGSAEANLSDARRLEDMATAAAVQRARRLG